jgi:hypothetical protein
VFGAGSHLPHVAGVRAGGGAGPAGARRHRRASGGCRPPACATRHASPRPARRCGATSCSTTAPRCCR